MKVSKYCLACNNQLTYETLNDYTQCRKCYSYNYVSDQAAEIDNNVYFNEMFKTLTERRESSLKRKIFGRLAGKDQQKRKQQYIDFSQMQEKILGKLDIPAKVLEIGFGSGEHLHSLLERGIDAYGVDSSITAVRNFQERYPKFTNRVYCGTRFNVQVDVIYCCALFEHLDQPEQFIQDAIDCLGRSGSLIIDGIPLLGDTKGDLTTNEDINFWKPCHRMIYSLEGLRTLFARYGFADEACAMHDDYYYRVLSSHLKYGYKGVIELRSFSIHHNELPWFPFYYFICRKALSINSLAYYGCIMFKKI